MARFQSQTIIIGLSIGYLVERGSDITVSLRAISTSGNAIYPAQLTGSNNGRVVTAV